MIIYIPVAASGAYGGLEELIDALPNLRNYLPEPFDFPDHIANMGGTLWLTTAAARVYWRNKEALETPAESKRKIKRFAALIGGLAVAANFVGEYLPDPNSTSDHLDFIYGLLGGYIAYQTQKPTILSPKQVDAIEDMELNSDNPDHTDLLKTQKKIEKAKADRNQSQINGY